MGGVTKDCISRLSMDHTDYRYDLEYRAHVHAHMSALLTRFLAGEIGVIEIAQAISPYSDLPEPEFRPHLNTFVGIDSETDALPAGTVRQHWAPEVLNQKDKEIAAAESRWREAATVAASHLARLVASSN